MFEVNFLSVDIILFSEVENLVHHLYEYRNVSWDLINARKVMQFRPETFS